MPEGLVEKRQLKQVRRPPRLAVPEINRADEEPPDETARYVDWTDDHTSLFSIIK